MVVRTQTFLTSPQGSREHFSRFANVEKQRRRESLEDGHAAVGMLGDHSGDKAASLLMERAHLRERRNLQRPQTHHAPNPPVLLTAACCAPTVCLALGFSHTVLSTIINSIVKNLLSTCFALGQVSLHSHSHSLTGLADWDLSK